jgi:peptidoglycan/xylan/chitin deacetylase (PgdA/CDA1 family)
MRRRSARDRVVYAAKWLVVHAMEASGLLTLWARVALRRNAVVLVYHRLLPEGTETWSHPGIVVTPSTFERHMRLLKRRFRPLTLGDFERHLTTREPFPAGSCLVTFDDGWNDTYTKAFPILKHHAIPAVVFLPTRFIGSTDTFWQEHLGWLLGEAGKIVRSEPAFRAQLEATLASCNMSSFGEVAIDGQRHEIMARIRDLKLDATVEPERATEALGLLLRDRPGLAHGDRFMTWDQAREMAREGMAFGVHGHTHRIMTSLSEAELSSDLDTARAIIEREIGVPVTSMSYPNGNWNESVATLVKARRFRAAFSMNPGHTAADDPPFSVRRLNIHEDVTGNDAFFMARILNVF